MTREVIIIHETVAQSIIKDAVSIGALTLAVGLGVYMQSDAMQLGRWRHMGSLHGRRLSQELERPQDDGRSCSQAAGRNPHQT